MASIDRRQFLKCSAITSLALISGNILFSQRGSASVVPNNYYLAKKNQLVNDFKEVINGASQLLAPELGAERTKKLSRDALANFENLLPDLPDVGGDRNLIAYLIPVAAWYVALYESMRQYRKTAEDTGKILYDLDELQYRATPEPHKKAMSERLSSPKYIEKFKEWALWTHKREYPANWVADFIEGKGNDFDYGCDYTECALVKYVTAQKVPELAPYICLADFPSSRAYNSGLIRTKTIATGDGVCNFRYKKGRAVAQDWSTEIGKIREKMGNR